MDMLPQEFLRVQQAAQQEKQQTEKFNILNRQVKDDIFNRGILALLILCAAVFAVALYPQPAKAAEPTEVLYVADAGVKMLPVKVIGNNRQAPKFVQMEASLKKLGMHERQSGEPVAYLHGCYVSFDDASFWTGCVDAGNEIRFLTLAPTMRYIIRSSERTIK